MNLLSFFELNLSSFIFIVFIVLLASIVRGFNGFGFSAICVSGLTFVLPTIEIVPIILILEVLISVFMIPYIWNKIDWKNQNVEKYIIQNRILKKGQSYIIIAGVPMGISGTTNLIRVEKIN